jgi:hypothetical protein
MEEQMTDSSDWAVRTNKNTIRLMCWTGAWTATMAMAAFGPQLVWHFDTLLTILATLINLGAGFGMILANKRNLEGLDELQRKIQLEAMALSLGVGLVVGLSYELLEDVHLITFQPEIPHVIMLMGLTYVVGIIVGNRRYR